MILAARSDVPGPGSGVQRFETLSADFTIGRGTDCDWTLADPARLLSKRHCRLTRNGDGWRITDLSSNGVTLNGTALLPGAPHPLHDGDRLGLGAYVIDVVAVSEEAPGGPPRASARFGEEHDGGRLLGDPFVSPGDMPITDPFDVSLPSTFEGGTGSRPEHTSRFAAGSEADAVSDLRTPFDPPRPSDALLPEDWLGPEPAHDGAASAPAQPIPDWKETDWSEAGPETSESTRAATSSDGPPEASAWQDAPPAIRPDAAPLSTATPPVPIPSPVPPPVPAAAPPLGTATPESAMLAAFAAFARGAGLEGAPRDGAARALEELGRAFRAAVVGLRRLMIARAMVKGEFRIDRTMIQPSGNNPLKFATDDDDALAALLGVGRQVGMSAEQAVADSLLDVSRHEMALTRALEKGIAELVAELSPAVIERELPRGALDALPPMRRSRAWQAYATRHARIEAELAANFDGVFGGAFARAYEAALADIGDAPDKPGARAS